MSLELWVLRVGPARLCLSLMIAAVLMHAPPASAQQRPLGTEDPEPVGTGHVLVEAGVSHSRDLFFPLSGLKGNLWQLPVIGLTVGLSPIADLQIRGGPYDRLSITDRLAAPLANLVTATGATTHDVDDLAIGAKVRVVPETTARPGFGFRFSVRLPNAKHRSGLGQDTTDFSAALLAGKTIAALRVAGNIGFTIMSEPLDSIKQNDVITYGLSFAQQIGHGAAVVGDVSGRWSARNGIPPAGTESRGTATAGGRYTHGPIRFDAGAFVGLTPVDPTIGLTAGFTYIFKAFTLP